MGVSVDDFVDVGEIRGRGGGRKHSADTLKLQKWHIFVSIPTIVCDAFGLMARRICAQFVPFDEARGPECDQPLFETFVQRETKPHLPKATLPRFPGGKIFEEPGSRELSELIFGVDGHEQRDTLLLGLRSTI